MKKSTLSLILIAISILFLAACGSGAASNTSSDSTDEASEPEQEEVENKEDRSQVSFWHSMSGANQEHLLHIVDGFNASQDEIYVSAQNQGSYDESTSKFFNVAGGDERPSVIQIGEQNLQSMIDSGLVEPMGNLVEDYNYNLDHLIPGIVNFYSVEQELYAMPFNSSSLVLYYNVEALEKAGLTEAPKTFEEITEAATAIADANEGMKAFSKPVYGYALDQMVTNMGGLIVNNDNGRSGRATEVAYHDQVKEVFTWIQDLIDKDQFVNYGINFDDMYTGFYNGDVSMFITTSAVAATIIDDAPFEVGLGYLPVPEDIEAEGNYAAGGAMMVSSDLPEEERAATTEFMEYATSPEVQAEWAGNTGYFAINTESYHTDTMKSIYEETPQLKVAADQFLTSKQTVATAGPLLSQLPQLRNDLESAEEMIFNNGDVDEAINQAAENTNAAIESANKSVGE